MASVTCLPGPGGGTGPLPQTQNRKGSPRGLLSSQPSQPRQWQFLGWFILFLLLIRQRWQQQDLSWTLQPQAFGSPKGCHLLKIAPAHAWPSGPHQSQRTKRGDYSQPCLFSHRQLWAKIQVLLSPRKLKKWESLFRLIRGTRRITEGGAAF